MHGKQDAVYRYPERDRVLRHCALLPPILPDRHAAYVRATVIRAEGISVRATVEITFAVPAAPGAPE